MMIVLALAMMLGGAVPSGDGTMLNLQGQCLHHSEPAPEPGDHEVACTSATVSPGHEKDGVFVLFGAPKGGQSVAFAGPVVGDTMTIRRIYAGPNTILTANNGHCRIFHQRGAVKSIICVGATEQARYLADFQRSN